MTKKSCLLFVLEKKVSDNKKRFLNDLEIIPLTIIVDGKQLL